MTNQYLNEMNKIEVGDVFLFEEGKKGKDAFISYTQLGKIIIAANASVVKPGYAKITKIIKDAEKYILVEAQKVVHDYYLGIDYDEFVEVLKLHGYKIGFERNFDAGHDTPETQLLAYKLETGVIIQAETYKPSIFGINFNSIYVYCPNVNGVGYKLPYFRSGNGTMTTLDIGQRKYTTLKVLKWIDEITNNPVWPEDAFIHLWTYADDDTSGLSDKWGRTSSRMWADTIDRILLVDPEIEQILGNVESLKPVFKSRKGVHK